jgi:CO/xanthine dehydrogenase Mo-binding subunit
MVRSGYAHGVINGIDTEAASQMPGVLGIYTGPDLTAAGIKNMPLGMAIPTADGAPPHRPSYPVLTSDKVRYVGDPIAIVVAEPVSQAKDAAEAVFVDIDSLPAVTSCKAAAQPGAPLIHEGVPDNVAAHFHYAMPKRSPLPLPPPRRSRASTSRAIASSSARWNRDRRSPNTTRRAIAIRCASAARACSD